MSNKSQSNRNMKNRKAGNSKNKKAVARNLKALGYYNNNMQLPPIPGQPRSVKVPAASSRAFQNRAPALRGSFKSCRIHHRELIDTVAWPISGSNFQPVKFPINPGSTDTFTWLAGLAQNWERYKFHKLSFHFLTRVASSFTGSFIMAVDHDAADSQPIDEPTMMTYEGAREDVVWKDISIVCSPKSLQGGRESHFVRTGALSANLDIKTYDVGNLWIAFDKVVSPLVTVGKLFVEYDVEFFTPQLPPSGTEEAAIGRAIQGGTVTVARPLGTAPANGVGVNLGTWSNDGALGDVFTFSQDVAAGLMDLNITGTAITNIGALPTLIDIDGNPAAGTVHSLINSVINAAATSASQSFDFHNVKAGERLILAAPTASTITGAIANLAKGIPGVFP